MTTVSFRYWAGAKAAAGVPQESVEAPSVGSALQAVRTRHADPRFDQVIAVCSFVVNEIVVRGEALEQPLAGPVEVDVLPPFAGG